MLSGFKLFDAISIGRCYAHSLDTDFGGEQNGTVEGLGLEWDLDRVIESYFNW